MHAIHPVSSPILWLRVLAAALVIVVLPGYLLAGRHVAGGRVARLVCSVSMGLLGTSLIGRVCYLAGLSMHPWTVTPVLALLGLGLGRWSTWRRQWQDVFGSLRPSSSGETLALVGLAGSWLILLVVVFGDFVVPPSVIDAANHAYLVRRIAETASLDPELVLAAPLGSLRVGYLVGWHLPAALVARTGGVAPYVATWLTTLAMLAMLPLALSLLWRALKVPAPLGVLGGIWLLTDAFTPSGILGWGGFGQLIGMALVPVLSLLVASGLRERFLLPAVVAGAALGAMVHVHASEVVVALGLGLLLSRYGGDPATTPTSRRPVWLVAGVGVLSLMLAAGPEVWSLAMTYRTAVVPEIVNEQRQLSDAVRRLLDSVGGPDQRHAAVLLGLGLGLANRRLRPLAVVAVLLGVFYLTLAVIGDPVSRALASPFYSQPPRILYLQAYVLPPLLSLPLLALRSSRITGRWRLPATILAGLLAVVWFGPGLQKTVNDLRSYGAATPFGESDYVHAVEMAQVIQSGELVANQVQDGGVWALHVSHAEGVLPHGWHRYLGDGTRLCDLVHDLTHEPWTASAFTMRDSGVVYLYVSDTVYELASHPPPLHRADLDADPRFEPMLVGATATLYVIHWDGD